MAKAQILIVEDDSIVVMELQDRLQSLGYAVAAVASSGKEAIEKAAETHPDLVLMDIRLKGAINGIEAAKEIRACFDIPVVYLTAYADENTLQRAKATEPYGYILKPFEERELRTNIEIALYKYQMERKLKESERWLATTLRSIGDAVIATDAQGCVMFMNPVAEALTGWKQEEALGKDLTEVFHIVNEETCNAVENPVERALQEGVVVGLANHTILIAKDGTETPIDDSAAPIRDEKENITGVVLTFRDITERRRAEEALKAAQEYARSIIDSSLDMIIAVDMDRHIVEFNKAAQETFGYRLEEVLGEHVDILYADPQEGLKVHQETLNKGQCVREILDRRKDGEVFPCFLSASVLRDACGELVGVMGVSRDITERKRVEKALKHRMEQLASLNQASQMVTSSLELDQVLAKIVSLASEVAASDYAGVVLVNEEGRLESTEYLSGVPDIERRARKNGFTNWILRWRQAIVIDDIDEDGTVNPTPANGVPCTVNPLIVEAGVKSFAGLPLVIKDRLLGVLFLQSLRPGNFCDQLPLLTTFANQAAVAIENARLYQKVQRRVEELTLLNRVGRAMASSLDLEQVLTTAMEETALMLKTEAGSVLLLEEESSELVLEAAVGPRSEGVKGLRLPPGQGIAGWVAREGQRLLVPDVGKDPRFYSGIDEVTGFVTKSVLAVPLKVKGKVIGVIEAVNKIKGDFGQMDVALLSSMAQPAAIAIENAQLYKDLQGQMDILQRTQAQLIRSAKLAAIGELAAGVAHEINNPLTSIMGFTRLLLQKMDDDDPMKEDLQIVDREAARTKAIVRGLLDFARQREPRLESADVNEIVRTTMTLVHHQAKGTGVIIRESFDETLPLVSLDANQIEQVFLNIVTNAIQAMPEGGELKVLTAYRPHAVDGTDCVAVEFHDTGTGIAEENLPRIFDPFFTTKEVGQGTGLGLSISYGIVESHGGWIEVETEMGQGSTFKVMLPVAKGHQAAPCLSRA
jgi:PAS domain S-box-containing protein